MDPECNAAVIERAQTERLQQEAEEQVRSALDAASTSTPEEEDGDIGPETNDH